VKRKNSKIVPLAIVFVVFIIFGVLRHSRPTSLSLVEEAGLESLVPSDFLVSDIYRVSVEMPKGSEEKAESRVPFELERVDEKTWTLASSFGAPGDVSKIDAFLEKIKGLEGERRSSTADVLSDYALKSDQAMVLSCFKQGAPTACVQLFVGKKAGRDNCFIRTAKNNHVYTVNVNFRSELGIHGDDLDLAPQAKHFLKSKFIDFAKANVTKLALTWPDKMLDFERKEKVKALDSTPESTSTTGEIQKPVKPEYEWVVTAGPNFSGFDGKKVVELLDAMSTLSGKDVKDPATLEKWGLDRPAYSATLYFKDGPPMKLLAGRPEASGKAYVRVGDGGAIYEVDSWSFEKVFPKGSKLFDLPAFKVAQAELQELEVVRGDEHFVMVRNSDDENAAWQAKVPADGSIDVSKLADLAWGLSACSIEDYVDTIGIKEAGLDPIETQVTYRLKDCTSGSLVIGKMTPSKDGYYVKLGTSDKPFVMKKSPVDRVVVPLSTLRVEAEKK